MFLRELPKPKKRMIYCFKGTVAELGKELQGFKEFMEFVGEQESELNTIAKAILELDIPESCWQCPCIQDRTDTNRWCGLVGGDCPNPPYEKRRDDCPLEKN